MCPDFSEALQKGQFSAKTRGFPSSHAGAPGPRSGPGAPGSTNKQFGDFPAADVALPLKASGPVSVGL